MTPPSSTVSTEALARSVRRESVLAVARARASHLGGALSCADVLAVLYGGVLSVRSTEPGWPDRDRFHLSKGHSCTALYAVLALRGFFPLRELEQYGADGSRLMAHVYKGVPGVEFSAGSLGHGLPVGCGRALAGRRRGAAWRTFVLMSDGELDEGSNWEAILFAGHHGLDRLVAVVDCNGIQSLGRVGEVLELEPLADKFRAFGWAVREVDGHDHGALRAAFGGIPAEPGRPTVVLARTRKGRGIDFMEDRLLWHYRSPDPAELERALAQLEEPRA